MLIFCSSLGAKFFVIFRRLVVCVLVRVAMDVVTVSVMPLMDTILVPVVAITPAGLIFLALVVVVYVGGVITGIWWARRMHWDGMVYFDLPESVIIFNLIAEGYATQVQSVPGGTVFAVALLLCPVLRPHVLHRGGEKKIKVVVEAVTSVQHSTAWNR